MASIEVLNATQANVEAPVEIQLSLGNPIYRGPEGKPGKDGVIGRDGKSAYEIAVENGFEGTETEWLESLKGADGTVGRDGAVGPQGEKGDTPVKGVDYFTEQDIEDFIAQVPQPDLSKYREIINIAWGDTIPDDDLIKLRTINDELANNTYDNRYVIFVGNTLVIAVKRGYKNNNCPDLIIFNDDKFFKYTPSSFNNDPNQVYYSSGQYVNLDASYITVLKNSAVSPVSQSLDTQFAYIKSQYATKTYVEEIVRGIETGALKRAVVEELPTEEIDENTIYMVPKTGSLNDAYNEYLYVENAWEHIGSTDVDLTNYRKAVYLETSENLDANSIVILNEIYNHIVALNLSYGASTNVLPQFDIFVNGERIEYLNISNTTITLLTNSSSQDSFQKNNYVWTKDSTRLWANGISNVFGDGLLIQSANSVAGAYPNNKIGNNFKYIKDNYVKLTDMPAYLTNTDILNIWNGTNE